MENLTFAAFQTAPASGQMETDLLHIIRSLGQLSSHPLAKQMVEIAKKNRIASCPVFGFQDFEGQGFGGAVQLPGEGGARAVLIGLRPFLEQAGLSVPNTLEVAARRWIKEEALVLFVGWDAHVRGLLKFK